MKTKLWTFSAIAILPLSACSANTESNEASSVSSLDDGTATVVRVIDGDTVEVKKAGEPSNTTVRLLNVNTPETKHPQKTVECMGPEASEYLKEMLPEGTPVTLEYDVELKDKYSRDLAGLYKDGLLINAEITREGLGTAVIFEPNKKFYQRVLNAQTEAVKNQKGLFDPQKSCTVLAQVQNLENQLSSANPQEVEAGISQTNDFIQEIDALTSNANYPWISSVTNNLPKKHTLEKLESLKQTKKQKLAELTNATAAPVSNPAGSSAQSGASNNAASSDQNVMVNQPPAGAEPVAPPQPTVAPVEQAPVPHQSVQPNPQPVHTQPTQPPAVQEPYPNYTGPRCYAPGGKTWRPC